MKAQVLPAANLRHKFISLLFVTMSIAFLSVPYFMSRHPGDPIQKSVSVERIR